MRQRLLFLIGAVMVLAAAGLGAVGVVAATRSATNPATITMMGGYGSGAGMMGGGGMMGGYYGQVPTGAQTISMDQARQAVEQYVSAGGNSGLELDELIEFQDNFYAIVKEKSTGIGAFEVLVNRVSGAVSPEPGPNMMWNTKYGTMAGGSMMGGSMMGFTRQTGPMTVSTDRASQIAQNWLDANQSGAVIEAPDSFYGYYTVHFKKDGKVAGMLSVNGYSGQLWYHSWHGALIQEEEIGS